MPDLNLSSEKKTQQWKAKFEKPQIEYAKLYCEDVRTIKRWISTGKKSGTLPPLDDPPAMLGWFEHNHTRPASKRLGELYGALKAKSEPAAVDLTQVRGLTPKENVENTRRNLAVIELRLRGAIERNDDGDIAIQQRNYKEMAEILRRWEVSLGEIEKASGEALPRAAYAAATTAALEMFSLGRQTMCSRVLVNISATLPKRLTRIWSKLEPHLAAAIEKARAEEDDVFRNVEANALAM